VAKPRHAGAAYNRWARTVALVTSWRVEVGSPCYKFYNIWIIHIFAEIIKHVAEMWGKKRTNSTSSLLDSNHLTSWISALLSILGANFCFCLWVNGSSLTSALLSYYPSLLPMLGIWDPKSSGCDALTELFLWNPFTPRAPRQSVPILGIVTPKSSSFSITFYTRKTHTGRHKERVKDLMTLYSTQIFIAFQRPEWASQFDGCCCISTMSLEMSGWREDCPQLIPCAIFVKFKLCQVL